VVSVLVAGLLACGGDDGASADEFCDRARAAESAGDDMAAALETGDPDEIERVFNESMDDFEAAVEAAPDAISDVAAEVTETAQDLRDRLEEFDWDVAAFIQDERVQQIAEESEGPNSDLDEFLEQECGIEPDETEDTDPPATTGTDGEDAGGEDESDDASADGGGLIAGALAAAFERLGLTGEEARCLADGLLDELGEEGLTNLDPTSLDEDSPQGQAILDVLEDCDIDPEVLANS
jgi:hypothetical protein